MALIICSECGKQFSDKAKACPNCGCPTELIEKTTPPETATKNDSTTATQHDSASTIKASYRNTELQLLSYDELQEFAFTSILPYIKKELKNTVMDVKPGSKNKNDVHYYLHCAGRIIGVKVIIDAYPDIYNVGKLFNDDRDNATLAKAMNAQGFEFAVAQIGIGSVDPTRFARRIFLKNVGYYFNYRQLNFHKASDYAAGTIRYSLSAIEPDHEWKTLAGFDYKRPTPKTNPNSDMLLQRPTSEKSIDYSKVIANHEFWKNDTRAVNSINEMFAVSYLDRNEPEALNQLIRMIAHVTLNSVGLEDAFYYTCNALDFLNGRFLSNSEPISAHRALIVLRELIEKNKAMNEYDLTLWKKTAINYLIYLFQYDRNSYVECVNGYYAATKPDDRPLSVIARKLENAFLEDPTRFGYGQDVVDEIARLQSINSPQNLAKYATMKAAIEVEMRQYCDMHEKIVVKRTLQLLGKQDEATLRKYSENAYEFVKYTETGFDNNLSEAHRRSMATFVAIVNAYHRCLGMDEVIVSRQVRGGYGLFQRMDDAKESKARYERFLYQRSK